MLIRSSHNFFNSLTGYSAGYQKRARYSSSRISGTTLKTIEQNEMKKGKFSWGNVELIEGRRTEMGRQREREKERYLQIDIAMCVTLPRSNARVM